MDHLLHVFNVYKCIADFKEKKKKNQSTKLETGGSDSNLIMDVNLNRLWVTILLFPIVVGIWLKNNLYNYTSCYTTILKVITNYDI